MGRRGPAYLVVRQPDGTLTCLPEWMTCQEASALHVRAVPRLPRQALAALRAVVGAFFSSDAERGEGRRSDAMATKIEASGAVRTGHGGTATNGSPAGGADQASQRSAIGGDHESGAGRAGRRA